MYWRTGHKMHFSWGRKKHINFFNINFLAPTQNPPSGPPEKSLCASFPGKEHKKGTHINFFGGIWGVKHGVPNGEFSATKSLVYFFFPALMNLRGLPAPSQSPSQSAIFLSELRVLLPSSCCPLKLPKRSRLTQKTLP